MKKEKMKSDELIINTSVIGQLEKTELLNQFLHIRNFSEKLVETLQTEDYCIQSMPDVSPSKWHLAHTSWFFETFILKEYIKNYIPFHPKYAYLFNSYYVLAGERFLRPARGLLSRPTVKEIFSYRKHVTESIADLIIKCSDDDWSKLAPVLEIGINHEQQHQELILTDIKHVFSINPLYPVYKEVKSYNIDSLPGLEWENFEEGIYEIGHESNSFAYDNETPRHKKYLESFSIASRLITNEEYLGFINDGGYTNAALWLSDGFATVENEKWKSPMYWIKKEDAWWNYTLSGLRPINLNEPVCHISYFEADAFARWSGCRLPLEEEWEVAAENLEVKGNFVEEENFHPVQVPDEKKHELHQMYGDVWEWTMSPYMPYPGFKTLPGALGEYNGKFMNSQMVLRGGSCATSVSHIRNTYRNFFPPSARWQFMGIRLAKDLK